MKTNNTRAGFTLVELLVVISIIAMLAGLLLPAINAARENGRRAQCISNQRQVAFAVINHDHTRGSIPPLRAPLVPDAYWTTNADDGLAVNTTFPSNKEQTELTWVGFILPFIEQNTAWGLISFGAITVGGNDNQKLDANNLYQLPLPILQCRSSGISPGESRINIVANAGPLNDFTAGTPPAPDGSGGTASSSVEFGKYTAAGDRPERDAKLFTVFFDRMVLGGSWWPTGATAAISSTNPCSTKISMENISTMDGTSTTILLSENEDAGHWIWYDATSQNVPIAWGTGTYRTGNNVVDTEDITEVESLIGFCYPGVLKNIASGEEATYTPLAAEANDGGEEPLFINEGRSNLNKIYTYRTRTARPSSGHPGVVVAAFCDQSTRVLRDDMDKQLFVRLCRPGSGVILNPKDLEF